MPPRGISKTCWEHVLPEARQKWLREAPDEGGSATFRGAGLRSNPRRNVRITPPHPSHRLRDGPLPSPTRGEGDSPPKMRESDSARAGERYGFKKGMIAKQVQHDTVCN